MRLSGTVRLRPVRPGFLIPPDDLNAIRGVARLCNCIWGGHYNPLIPWCEGETSRWYERFYHVRGIDVTRQYVDFFEPDVLVETRDGMAAELGWAPSDCPIDMPRIVKLEQFYKTDDVGRVEFAVGADITDVMHHLYDKEYKYQRRHKIPFAHFEQLGDDAYFDVVLGTYAGDEALAYIQDNYKEIFEPEALLWDGETARKILEEGYAGPAWISRYGLEENLGRGREDHTVVIFDPCNPADVIDYWNLRLHHRHTVPVNVAWLPECADLLREQIQAVYRPIPGNPFGTMFDSCIYWADSISDDSLRALVSTHFSGLPRGAFRSGRMPKFWNIMERDDHRRTTRILPTAKSESFDVAVGEGGYARVPILEPEFNNAAGTHARSYWVNVVTTASRHRQENFAAVYPSNLWHPAEPGLSISRDMTITREGWVIPHHMSIGYDLLRPSTGREALIAWLKAEGIDAYPSEEGQVAAQVIAAAGGLMPCGMFANRDTMKLLNDMAESTGREKPGQSERAIGPDRAAHIHTVKNHFDERQKQEFDYWTKLDYFLDRSVFKAGLRVQCPICANRNWYDLDSAGYTLTCARCLKPFKLGQSPQDLGKLEWYYRVIGPFAAPGYARGGYAVALTLRCLNQDIHDELTWSTGLRLEQLDCEVDFAAWHRRDKHSDGEGEEPALVFGEAKSFGKNAIDDSCISSLKKVGERFPGSFLIVSSLRPIGDYSHEERLRLTDLAKWGRRPGKRGWRPANPVIILTGTELFFKHHLESTWKDSGGLAAELAKHMSFNDLYKLAEATQKLYLNLPSFYEEYAARARAQRRHLVVLLQERTAKLGIEDSERSSAG